MILLTTKENHHFCKRLTLCSLEYAWNCTIHTFCTVLSGPKSQLSCLDWNALFRLFCHVPLSLNVLTKPKRPTWIKKDKFLCRHSLYIWMEQISFYLYLRLKTVMTLKFKLSTSSPYCLETFSPLNLYKGQTSTRALLYCTDLIPPN